MVQTCLRDQKTPQSRAGFGFLLKGKEKEKRDLEELDDTCENLTKVRMTEVIFIPNGWDEAG